MKSNRYSNRFAMSALAALLAMPAFAANIPHPGDQQYRAGDVVPGDVIDPVNGNDMRDNRDSTVMRNEKGTVPNPVVSGIDTENGNDFRDNRDSTILRSDVPHDQTNMGSSWHSSSSSGSAKVYE